MADNTARAPNSGATDKTAAKYPKIFRAAADIDAEKDTKRRTEIRHNYEEQGKLYLDQWKEILEDVKPVIISTLHCCDSWERVPEDLKSLIDAMERYIKTLGQFADHVTEHRKLPDRAKQALKSFEKALENNFSYGRDMLAQENHLSQQAMENFEEALELQKRIFAARSDRSCIPSGKTISFTNSSKEAQDALQSADSKAAEATESLNKEGGAETKVGEKAVSARDGRAKRSTSVRSPEPKAAGGRGGSIGEAKEDATVPLLPSESSNDVEAVAVDVTAPNHVPLVVGILLSLCVSIGLFAWLSVLKHMSFP